MLDGLRRYDRIIAGAYSDRNGGVCPMLAAHRCGGRTDFRSFARAWDGFTGAKRRPRPATDRERRTLEAQLEVAVMEEERRRDLVAARARGVRGRGAPPRGRASGQAAARRSAAGAATGSARSVAGTATAKTVSRVAGELERAGLLDQSKDTTDPATELGGRAPPRDDARLTLSQRSPPARSPGRTIITSGMMQAGDSSHQATHDGRPRPAS